MALSLEGVTKSFGGTVALAAVDVEVHDREFFSIVGPSGCGKSTLLRLVAGLERPDSGTVHIDGTDVTLWEPVERGIGMVFQNYALFPHLTAADNIGFGLKGRVGKDELRRRVAEVAELLELDKDMLARRPRQLSGGQRQRVALGRALVKRPRVLLMDEPLSGADALMRERMRAELRRFHDRAGTTTLYVTHDQREAMSMSDRIMVMDHGALHQVGRPIEVYRHPRTAFVARFIGAPGMNVWPMALTPGAGGQVPLSQDGEPWPLDVPAGHLADEVLVGVRPEHVRLAMHDELDVRLHCRLGSVEPQGEQALVHARYGQYPIVATVPADEAEDLSPALDLWLSVQDLHLFSSADGSLVAGRRSLRQSALSPLQ